jgi:glutamate/tyrosine decarboxylase-like PLP-dependent enzyme
MGFVEADSWAMGVHKWLNVPYDSGVAVVRDPKFFGERCRSAGHIFF